MVVGLLSSRGVSCADVPVSTDVYVGRILNIHDSPRDEGYRQPRKFVRVSVNFFTEVESVSQKPTR